MRPLFIVGIVFLFWWGAINAGESSAPLTLNQAINILQQQNLTLQQQEVRLKQSALKVAESKTHLYPTLNLQGQYNYVSELASMNIQFPFPGVPGIHLQAGTHNQYDIMALIEQPLFTGFRLTSSVKLTRANLQQLRAQKNQVTNRLYFQVHRLFHLLQLNTLQTRAVHASMKRVKKNLEMVRNFYQAGQATRYDTMRVANRLLSLQTALTRLKHQKEVLRTRLELLLNYSPIDSVHMVSEKEISLQLQPRSHYLQMALSRRPELQQIQFQQTAARYQRKIALSQYYPQVFAFASYHYARPGVNFFQREWMDYYTVGVNLKWNIWNWGRTRKQVQQTSLTLDLLNLEYNKIKNDIEQEIAEIYQYLQNDLEQIELKKQLLEQEKERYRVTREKYRQGIATLVDLSDAEAALTTADLQIRQAFISLLIHQAQMKMAMGEFLPQ